MAGTLLNFDTALGSYQVDLFDTVAPQTVTNFLHYVNTGEFTNTIIHRAATTQVSQGVFESFVVQGGGYAMSQWQSPSTTTFPQHIPTIASPPNEFHLTNALGTIAMAKGQDPNSATSEWFVNMRNNSFLDTQNSGFTVFGWVMGTGMNVLKNVEALPKTTVNFLQQQFEDVPQNGAGFLNLNGVTVVKTHASFQNPILAMDVNNDNVVKAQDVLVIFNDLAAKGTHAASAAFVGTTFTYVDVNGDGIVNPKDALNAINYVNTHPAPALAFYTMQFAIVPEPSSIALAATATLALGAYAARRRLRQRRLAC